MKDTSPNGDIKVWSDRILNYLIEKRKTDSNVRFWVRQRDNKNRLSSGQWFQGNEGYIFIGIYNRSGGVNKTRSVGLVVWIDNDGQARSYIEVVWKGEKNKDIIEFYKDFIEKIGGFEKQEETKFKRDFPKDQDVFAIIDQFYSDYKPKMDEVMLDHGLKDQLELTDELMNKSLEKIKGIKAKMSNNSDDLSNISNVMVNTNSLNQILYGPPGTGKTYHTINKALAIIEGKSEAELQTENRSDLKKRFDEYLKNGQIVFTTFHQSLSYEDFIEGLKPETKSGTITYEIKDGIFKELCKVASSKKNRSFSEAYEKLVSDLKDKTTIEIDLEGGKSFNITLLQNGEDLDVAGEVDLSTIRRKSLAYIASQKNKFGGKWAKPFKGIYRYLEKNYEYNPNDIENTIKPHVLIIDEINRGNVSQIFGELITLIEVDKRAGMKETIEITLPYSGDPFSVPSNLYIIGTMNTADRSVEALDVALRRRFHFQEMMPNPDLVEPLRVLYFYWIKMYGKYGGSIDSYRKHEIDLWEMLGLTIVNEQAYVGFGDSLGSEASFDTFKETMRTLVQFEGGINFKELLEVINGRIKYLKDEDHQIGHSYLMNVFSKLELAETFNKNIIPLLKEYFYNDYGKIRLVLGDGFFTQVEEAPKMAVEDQNDFIGSMRYQLQEITAENIAEKLKLTLGV